ncbi:Hint domain-containing protein [Jannaschia sp. S6380]|uniref:Hint domain-containing protein n=1 Tax=Jannaschia sp. S6380 TaxID=2926408 RepID=UPI001FF36C3C|nr:Hint domain-containing protein [Jannaschia sp. S6380]MCK0169282.1 Hint domain-containing protein [Jannaschia sp. S6380]
MLGTCAGAQVISTVQARVDGDIPSTRTPFPTGSIFRWFGAPLRLDGARAALLLSDVQGRTALRTRPPRAAGRLRRARNAVPRPHVAFADEDDEHDPSALILASGQNRWSARAVRTAAGEVLLVFDAGVPPPNTELEVLQSPALPPVRTDRKTVCFTQGTRIDTPEGPRPVEDLSPGAHVLTRDGAAQEVLWTGRRAISGARLFAMPSLRPVRLRAGTVGNAVDLRVSPGHLILWSGTGVRALWSEPEVLVRAQDLVDDRSVTIDHVATEVTYHHILLRDHGLVRADGAWCESFHPGDADLDHLAPADLRALLGHVPGIDADPSAYGPHARRCLSAAELAITRHQGAPRYLA